MIAPAHDPSVIARGQPRAMRDGRDACAAAAVDPAIESAGAPGADTTDAAAADAERALDGARVEIERIDAALVALVAERVRWSEAVGAAKRRLGRPTLDPAREAAVVRRAGALARAAGVDDEVVRAVFWQLMAMARRAQQAQRAP